MGSEIKRLGFKSQTLRRLECLGPVKTFTAACLLWGIPKPAWVSALSLISYHFSILVPNLYLSGSHLPFLIALSSCLCSCSSPIVIPGLSSFGVFRERVKGSTCLNWPVCPLDRVVFKEDQEHVNSFLFSVSFRHCFFFSLKLYSLISSLEGGRGRIHQPSKAKA